MSNNNIPFRSSRDRLIELAPHLVPNPLPDLPVEPINFRPVLSTEHLVVGSVEKGETAMIYVDQSQRAVQYQLYAKNGNPVGQEVEGNCDRIAFETDVLTADEWYEFYIVATRPSTGEFVTLNTRIWINAGNIDGVDPSPLEATPRYAANYTVVIPDTQPNLEWQLFHGNGDPASDPVDSTMVEENESSSTTTITLVSYPMYENENLIIHVRNELTEEEKNLSQTPEIRVYPNPNLLFVNNGTPLHPQWNSPVQIKVKLPQSTVYYQLVRQVGNELVPSGDAMKGEGTEIILTSAALPDISTLRVLAVKRDPDPQRNLEEYLLGEIEVVVYPDPSIVATLNQEVVDYAATITVQLPEPQAETTYFLHKGDGIQLGTAVVSDGNPLTLSYSGETEDCELYIRATRRNLSNDLSTTLSVFVRPNLDLEIELPHIPFDRNDGTVILVPDTQASVEYILYKIPGDWETFRDRIECSRAMGNAATLSLPTEELNAHRYTFYVEARKENPLRLGRLRSSIYLEVTLRTDTPVIGGAAIIDYERTTTLEVTERQTCVNYTPVSGATLLGETLDFRAENAPLQTFPLKEDTLLQVKAVHCLTFETIVLDFQFPVEVGPKLNIEVTAPQPHVEFEGAADLHFSDGQASVTYEVRGFADFYVPGPVPEGFDFSFSPAADGPFVMPFGPLTFPMRLMIVARKTVNGMADALFSEVQVAPYPDASQEVRLLRAPVAYGSTADIEIDATDWQTNYALKLRNGDPIGGQQATAEPGLITLSTFPLEEDTRVYVCATSLAPQIGLSLHQKLRIEVPPNLNLLPELSQITDEGPGRDFQATIHVAATQQSAQYRLEVSSGDEFGFDTTSLLPHRVNGGGSIYLRATRLRDLRYRIRVFAEKHPSQLSGFLHTAVEFYVGVIRSNSVTILNSIVDYDQTATLTIFDAQPEANYQLFSQNNEPLSAIYPTGTLSENLVIETFPLKEDQEIQVHVENQLTSISGFLNQVTPVQVRPNENLNPVMLDPVIDFDGMVNLRLSGAQKSVEYVAIQGPTTDPGAPQSNQEGSIISTFQPHVDGVFELAFGPFQYDQQFTLKAIKANSRLEYQFPDVFDILVRPNHGLEVQVAQRQASAGDRVRILLPRSQRGVRYRLRDVNAPPGEGFGTMEGFNHFNVPLGTAHVEDDLAVYNDGGGEITLYTEPFVGPGMHWEIWAKKDYNGLEATLLEPIVITEGTAQ